MNPPFVSDLHSPCTVDIHTHYYKDHAEFRMSITGKNNAYRWHIVRDCVDRAMCVCKHLSNTEGHEFDPIYEGEIPTPELQKQGRKGRKRGSFAFTELRGRYNLTYNGDTSDSPTCEMIDHLQTDIHEAWEQCSLAHSDDVAEVSELARQERILTEELELLKAQKKKAEAQLATTLRALSETKKWWETSTKIHPYQFTANAPAAVSDDGAGPSTKRLRSSRTE